MLVACSSDDDKPKGNDRPAAKVTALRGTIKRVGGSALSGVTVRAGSVSATSDSDGRYELKAPAGKTKVTFSREGYVDGHRSPALLSGVPTQLDIALLPLASPQPLDATTGGKASGMRGAAVEVPAGAFVDASGEAVSGMVDVYLTPLDPSSDEERAAAPEFVTESDGDQQLLESQGLVDIQVRRDGEPLQVASGKTLEISIPVPAGSEPEPTIDLWSFAEERGIWVHEGQASYDASTRTYVGSAAHMSLWNADQVYSATCVCGITEEKDGGALAGARVEAHGVSYFGTSSAHTDEDGEFCVAVRKDSEVDIVVYHASTGGQSRRIMSGDEDTMVPPRAGDGRCRDAGRWRVEKDVYESSSGEMQSCGGVDNPFANGCAKQLGEVFGGCFKPEGECTINYAGTQIQTTYSNGAYMESTTTGARYYSSAGKLCATATYQFGSTEEISFQYMVPGAGTFTMTIGAGGTGDYVIQCPNGQETRVTTEQQQALQACTMTDTTGEGAECKIEGLPTLDGGVEIPGTCTKNADCTADMICCAIPEADLALCTPQATCDQIKQQM